MARLHRTSKSGRHGSTPPLRTEAPEWQPVRGKDVESQVVTLAKEGKSTSLIGFYLRDQFGVPDVKLATGKTVLQILTENGMSPKLPEDITNLLKRVVSLQEHLAKHPKDLHEKRSLSLTEAKIRRLAKYHRRIGRLPADWTYATATARLLLE